MPPLEGRIRQSSIQTEMAAFIKTADIDCKYRNTFSLLLMNTFSQICFQSPNEFCPCITPSQNCIISSKSWNSLEHSHFSPNSPGFCATVKGTEPSRAAETRQLYRHLRPLFSGSLTVLGIILTDWCSIEQMWPCGCGRMAKVLLLQLLVELTGLRLSE